MGKKHHLSGTEPHAGACPQDPCLNRHVQARSPSPQPARHLCAIHKTPNSVLGGAGIWTVSCCIRSMCSKPPYSPVFLSVMDYIILVSFESILFFYNFFQTYEHLFCSFWYQELWNWLRCYPACKLTSWRPILWMLAEDTSPLGGRQRTLLLTTARVSTFSWTNSPSSSSHGVMQWRPHSTCKHTGRIRFFYNGQRACLAYSGGKHSVFQGCCL